MTLLKPSSQLFYRSVAQADIIKPCLLHLGSSKVGLQLGALIWPVKWTLLVRYDARDTQTGVLLSRREGRAEY